MRPNEIIRYMPTQFKRVSETNPLYVGHHIPLIGYWTKSTGYVKVESLKYEYDSWTEALPCPVIAIVTEKFGGEVTDLTITGKVAEYKDTITKTQEDKEISRKRYEASETTITGNLRIPRHTRPYGTFLITGLGYSVYEISSITDNTDCQVGKVEFYALASVGSKIIYWLGIHEYAESMREILRPWIAPPKCVRCGGTGIEPGKLTQVCCQCNGYKYDGFSASNYVQRQIGFDVGLARDLIDDWDNMTEADHQLVRKFVNKAWTQKWWVTPTVNEIRRILKHFYMLTDDEIDIVERFNPQEPVWSLFLPFDVPINSPFGPLTDTDRDLIKYIAESVTPAGVSVFVGFYDIIPLYLGNLQGLETSSIIFPPRPMSNAFGQEYELWGQARWDLWNGWQEAVEDFEPASDGMPNKTGTKKASPSFPEYDTFNSYTDVAEGFSNDYVCDASYSFTKEIGRGNILKLTNTSSFPSGYYPATYSFTNVENGEDDPDWTDTSGTGCTAQIISGLDGHTKIYELYDNGSGSAILTNSFSSSQTSGTIELWFRTTDTSKQFRIVIRDSTTYAMWLSVNTANGMLRTNQTGIGNTDVAQLYNDTWHHIRIDFNCVAYTHNITVDDIDYGSFLFYQNRSTVDNFYLQTDNTTTGYYLYLDAVGYSWDDDYNISDNRTTQDNHYFGTYSFDNDEIGEVPEDWVDGSAGSSFTDISGTVGGHNKVLHLYQENGTNSAYITHTLDTAIAAGIFECWYYCEDLSGTGDAIILNDSSDQVALLVGTLGGATGIFEGKYNGQIGSGIENNTWYRLKIDFDCDPETYDVYFAPASGEYALIGSGCEFFTGSCTALTKVIFGTIGTGGGGVEHNSFIDACGFSWDTGYFIENNRLQKSGQIWYDISAFSNIDRKFSFWVKGDFTNYLGINFQREEEKVFSMKIKDNLLYVSDDGEENQLTGISNAWHKITTDIDLDDKQYGVYLDEVLQESNLNFNSEASRIYAGSWSFTDGTVQGFTNTGGVTNYKGHHNCLYTDTSVNCRKNWGSNIYYGVVEFWVRKDGGVTDWLAFEKDGTTELISIEIDNSGKLTSQSSGGDVDWSPNKWEDGKWMRIKIEFECTTGGYRGLSQYTYNGYVHRPDLDDDYVLCASGHGFKNNGSYINSFDFRNYGGHITYFDGIGVVGIEGYDYPDGYEEDANKEGTVIPDKILLQTEFGKDYNTYLDTIYIDDRFLGDTTTDPLLETKGWTFSNPHAESFNVNDRFRHMCRLRDYNAYISYYDTDYRLTGCYEWWEHPETSTLRTAFHDRNDDIMFSIAYDQDNVGLVNTGSGLITKFMPDNDIHLRVAWDLTGDYYTGQCSGMFDLYVNREHLYSEWITGQEGVYYTDFRNLTEGTGFIDAIGWNYGSGQIAGYEIGDNWQTIYPWGWGSQHNNYIELSGTSSEYNILEKYFYNDRPIITGS